MTKEHTLGGVSADVRAANRLEISVAPTTPTEDAEIPSDRNSATSALMAAAAAASIERSVFPNADTARLHGSSITSWYGWNSAGVAGVAGVARISSVRETARGDSEGPVTITAIARAVLARSPMHASAESGGSISQAS